MQGWQWSRTISAEMVGVQGPPTGRLSPDRFWGQSSGGAKRGRCPLSENKIDFHRKLRFREQFPSLIMLQ